MPIQEHKYRRLYSLILGAWLCYGAPAPVFAATVEADRQSAVVFVYQRIDDVAARGSISVEQFDEHLRELKNGNYTILPLSDVVTALREGRSLPQNTVAITLEGGWASTLKNAIPRLNRAGFPYTLFYASDMHDSENPQYMSWKELKALHKSKLATLGILPASYVHMADLALEENIAYINKAKSRHHDEFGQQPAFFAYPYGEISTEVRDHVATYGFEAAFGQHSGVVYPEADLMALPRFIMTDNFGDSERFLLTAHALPLPVRDVTPQNMVITENPPMIGFTVTPEIQDISSLSCFLSGVGKVETLRPGDNRVEIRLEQPLEERRTRINCTMPDDTVIPGQPQNWRWFGQLLTLPGYGEEAPETTGSVPAP